MRLIRILAAAAALALSTNSYASVTINFGLGTMYAGGTTNSSFFANGGRINLLALNSGTWSALPSLLNPEWTTLNQVFANQTNSFTPAGVTLVGTIGNDNSGGDGITGGVFTFDYAGGFGPGDQLLAVGYSSLTTNSSSPGLGTLGFFFRTDSIIDGSDMAWVAPADGFSYTLGAYTDPNGSLSASQLTSGNGAIGGSGFTTVPEPSTYALLALSGLAFGGYVFRRRRRV